MAEHGSPKITSAVLAAAIVKQLPQHDSLLANMKIDFHDIEEAIRWYERIKALIDQYKEKPLNTGGIARDWSFGYTPLLSRFAQNISVSVSGGAFTTKLAAHEEALGQMLKRLVLAGGRTLRWSVLTVREKYCRVGVCGNAD